MNVAQKVKITFGKHGLIRFIGHLDTMDNVFFAMRRAGLPLCYTEGFNPRIKASFSPSLSLGFSSDVEFIEASLSEVVQPEKLKDMLQKELPDGITVKQVEELPLGGKSLSGRIESMEYQFNPGEYSREREAIEEKRKSLLEKDGIISIDIDDEQNCTMVIEMGKGRAVSPREIAKVLLDVGDDEIKQIEFTRKKFFFKV